MSGRSLIAVSLLLLLLVGIAWWVTVEDEPDPAAPGRGDDPTPTMPDVIRAEIPESDPGGAVERLPAPIDFATADRERDLHGIVVDEKGEGLAGVTLSTFTYPWRRSVVLNADQSREKEPGPQTRSARDGTFLLRLERGRLVHLRATAAGFAETVIPNCQAGERLRVLMTEGTTLVVTVKDEDGKPAVGVEARLWRNAASRAAVFSREGISDAEGRISFTGLTPGSALLSVSPTEFGAPAWEQVKVPGDGTIEMAITLYAGRTIVGTVTDAETGRPIGGAKVGAGWTVRRPVTTDSDGRYAFVGWSGKGVNDLHVLAEGYGRQGKKVPAEGALDFELDVGTRVIGRVLSAKDEPVAAALVSAVAYQRTGVGTKLDTRSTRTDDDGRFELTSLRADMEAHTLTIMARGHGKLQQDFMRTLDGGPINLGDIRLPEARAIAGRVVGPDGKPLPGLQIQIRNLAVHAASHYGNRESRRSDDLGRFHFPDLSPGSYAIGARPAGFPYLSKNVTLTADADLTDVELAFSGGGSVTVVVTDLTGKAVPNAHVSVGASSATTGSNGTATVMGIQSGEHLLLVYPRPSSTGPSLLRAQVEGVKAEGQTIQVALTVASRVSGVVKTVAGVPVAGLLIRGTGGAGESYLAVTSETGEFSFQVEAGVKVDLEIDGTVMQPGAGPSNKSAFRGRVRGVVAPAENVQIQVEELASDRTLTVVVTAPDGKPVPSATVYVDRKTALTGANGEADFTGLPAEETRVMVVSAGLADWLPEDAVQPDPVMVLPEGQRVALQFELGVALTGRVFLPDGSPAVGAQVRVISNSASRTVTTDSDGRFRSPVRAGARANVAAMAASGSKWLQASLQDVSPEDGEITLRLEEINR